MHIRFLRLLSQSTSSSYAGLSSGYNRSVRKLLRNLVVSLLLLLVGSFGVTNHAVAVPSSMHETAGMDHGGSQSSSARCATLCTSAVFSKEESIKPIYEEQDDEPGLPFYLLSQDAYLYSKHNRSYSNAFAMRPPPKVPIYILFGVFRV